MWKVFKLRRFSLRLRKRIQSNIHCRRIWLKDSNQFRNIWRAPRNFTWTFFQIILFFFLLSFYKSSFILLSIYEEHFVPTWETNQQIFFRMNFLFPALEMFVVSVSYLSRFVFQPNFFKRKWIFKKCPHWKRRWRAMRLKGVNRNTLAKKEKTFVQYNRKAYKNVLVYASKVSVTYVLSLQMYWLITLD